MFETQRFIKFPSIGEFRNVCKVINDRNYFHQLNKNPVLTFTGTVKAHGANASIVLQRGGKIYSQSRENICTPELSLYGFYDFVEATRDEWQKKMEELLESDEYSKADALVICGEWCGGDIQKNVAITGLPMMFIIFTIKTQVAGLVKEKGEMIDGFISTYHPLNNLAKVVHDKIKPFTSDLFKSSVYSIMDFGHYAITIDFNSPLESQNELIKLTMEVERKCPIGSYFRSIGVGEGIVWSAEENEEIPYRIDDLRFKVKGPKHSDTKVNKLVSVDVEKIRSAREFAELVTTEHRFEKGIDFLRQTLGDSISIFEKENTSAFIGWVTKDVIKEQTDTMLANNLDSKHVLPLVSKMARTWFNSKITTKE